MYDTIIPIIDQYKYVLFIRIDLYLKNIFFEIFTLHEDKILFAHIDSNTSIGVNEIGISHLIMAYPCKLYKYLKEKNVYNSTHEMRHKLILSGLPKENIGLIVDIFHVCSTDLGWNPLYIQVGRYYNNSYNLYSIFQHTIRYYYDQNIHEIKDDINKTIKYWEPHLNKDTLQELLESNYDW